MATKTSSTSLTRYKVHQVASDEVLEEMQASGQLEPFGEYYTPDEQDAPFMPVGSIFISAIPLSDARVHLLDGSTIPQDGIYEDFANLIKSLVAAGNNIAYDTNEEFNTDVSATGNCGKFVIDNTAGTIRLPKITTFIQGLSNIADIGKSLEAGLPSITHTHPQYITANSGSYMGRQDYTADRGSSDIYPHVNTGTNSAVSPIYGKSSTVQPNATQFPYYIVLANGYKSSALVKIDNIMTELNYVLKKMYPVGSIYTSNDLSNSPMNVLGFGTWERIVGRTLIGAAPDDGTDYSSFLTRSSEGYWYYADGAGNRYSMAVGSQSGTPNVALTSSEMPKHRHGPLYWNNGLSIGIGSGVSGSYYRVSSSTSSNTISTEAQTADAGGGKAHNNLPPYLAVYMWQRVE